MSSENGMKLINNEHIQRQIFSVRGVQVMLDSDLASLYQTETKFINRAVKRNPLRFPEEFMFQLTEEEWANLKYQIGTSSDHGGRRTLPFAFSKMEEMTETVLANLLKIKINE